MTNLTVSLYHIYTFVRRFKKYTTVDDKYNLCAQPTYPCIHLGAAPCIHLGAASYITTLLVQLLGSSKNCSFSIFIRHITVKTLLTGNRKDRFNSGCFVHLWFQAQAVSGGGVAVHYPPPLSEIRGDCTPPGFLLSHFSFKL